MKDLTNLLGALLKYLEDPTHGAMITVALIVLGFVLAWIDFEVRKASPDRPLLGQDTLGRLKSAMEARDWKLMTHEHVQATTSVLRSVLGLPRGSYQSRKYHARLLVYIGAIVAPALIWIYTVQYAEVGLYEDPVVRSHLPSFLFSHTISYVGTIYLSMVISVSATLLLLDIVERHSLPILFVLFSLLDAVIAGLLIYLTWVASSALTDAIWIALMDEYELAKSFPVRDYINDIFIQLLQLFDGSIANFITVYSAAVPTILHLAMTLIFLVTIYLPERLKDLSLGVLGLFHSEEKSVLRTISGLLILISSLAGSATVFFSI